MIKNHQIQNTLPFNLSMINEIMERKIKKMNGKQNLEISTYMSTGGLLISLSIERLA